MTFSATDAAFEGFRVVRRKPLVLLWWAAFYLVSFALIFLVAAGPIAGLMAAAADLENMGPGATPEDLHSEVRRHGGGRNPDSSIRLLQHHGAPMCPRADAVSR